MPFFKKKRITCQGNFFEWSFNRNASIGKRLFKKTVFFHDCPENGPVINEGRFSLPLPRGPVDFQDFFGVKDRFGIIDNRTVRERKLRAVFEPLLRDIDVSESFG